MIKAVVRSPDGPSLTKSAPRVNPDPREHTNVLLSHAPLYILGDKYDVGPLHQRTAPKLNETREDVRIRVNKTQSIRAPIASIFENTRSDGKTRSLLIRHVTCIVEDPAKESDSPSLSERCAEAASVLMAKMPERLGRDGRMTARVASLAAWMDAGTDFEAPGLAAIHRRQPFSCPK